MSQIERDRIRDENWARQRQKREEERRRHEAYLKGLEEKRRSRERERLQKELQEQQVSQARKAEERFSVLLEQCLIELRRLENLGKREYERVFTLKGRAIRKAVRHIQTLEQVRCRNRRFVSCSDVTCDYC